MDIDTDDYSVMADGHTTIFVRHDLCGDREALGTGVIYPSTITRWIERHVCSR